MKTIKELCEGAYSDAKAAGWHDQPREIGTMLMLIVSEIAEAMEADPKCKWASLAHFDMDFPSRPDESFKSKFERWIKDTFADELADAVIRIADLCGKLEIDLERHIELKMMYNRLRGYKHGGKKY